MDGHGYGEIIVDTDNVARQLEICAKVDIMRRSTQVYPKHDLLAEHCIT